MDEKLDILLDSKSWRIKSYIESNENIHLTSLPCSNDAAYIEIPIETGQSLHWHFPSEKYSFDDVLEYFDAIEDYFDEKAKEVEQQMDRQFRKLFSTSFLEKAPPKAIDGQKRRYESLKNQSEEIRWFQTMILNQEIKWLSFAIRSKDDKD